MADDSDPSNRLTEDHLPTPTRDALPSELCILPWSERPLLPTQTIPLTFSDKINLLSLKKLEQKSETLIGLLFVPKLEGWTPNQPHAQVGCCARIHHVSKNHGKYQCVVEGLIRFQIVDWVQSKVPFTAQVIYPDNDEENLNPIQIKAYAIAIINLLKELTPLNPIYSEEIKFFLNRFVMTEPSALTDFAATLTTAEKEDIQEILETVNLSKRMEKVIHLIKQEVDVIQLQAKIRTSVESRMTEQQRQFFLKEQLKAIQKELGISKDDRTADRDRFEERIETLDIPEPAMKRIDEELDKLSILEMGSPEYAVTRNYLDVITGLPWSIYSKEKFNLKRARRILDKEHEGLEDIKDRIIEFIAVGALKGEVSGSIILLVGPPGVGKTSVGRSIASALGRKFYRFSVGGMKDEAEIKGHRRTYIGAMPGKIIHALMEVETSNPVIMLDEIDKIGSSYQGDPASALLEVLDPEQQHDFLDHYLDIRFDLSKVLFVCTANQIDTIPQALLDRMEIMRLSGYIFEEKYKIAKKHLWPKVLDKSGLKKTQLELSNKALRQIIEGYAREAGVRNLEKNLARIARKTAVDFVSHTVRHKTVEPEDLENLLGPPIFLNEKAINGIGVATGLAWTALGGVTLSIEANKIHSKTRGFKLTGKLGSVMKESAEIAYSYVISHLTQYGGAPDFFDEAFLHLHVPEGATPKDGPSAGITMASALLSLALNQKIPPQVTMTGELTLTGQVLAVGGIREKMVAAKRSHRNEVILPEACRGDFNELPNHIKSHLTVHFVEHYRQIFDLLFKKKVRKLTSTL